MKITFTKREINSIIENVISWMITLMMFAYGVGKVAQFNGTTALEKTLPELTGMELMWAFYGYSYPFALTIGFLEILSGALIFFNRTRIIGCFFTTTILVNIILQDLVFDVHKGALVTAIILQLFVFIILWMNKSKVMNAIQIITTTNKIEQDLKKKIIKLITTFIGLVVLWFLQNHLISFISQFL